MFLDMFEFRHKALKEVWIWNIKIELR
jgi:hypothetical protein